MLLAGCAAMRAAPPVRTYRLAYQPPQPERSTPLPVTIRVVPFGIASAYDRAAFVYRAGPYDVGVDPYNEWISNPAGMITDLLARDLSASRIVQAVLQGPSALPADYELNGQIETFEERDDDGGCSAHVRVRILLAHSPPRGTRRVVLQQSFAVDEPCTRGDPESYVAAMSRAVQRLSDEIRAVIRAILESA